MSSERFQRKRYRIPDWTKDERVEVDIPFESQEWDVSSSEGLDGLHYPILDIDIDHAYVESSTPGHGHIYFRPDKGCTWPQYCTLLYALRDCGIISSDYVRHSIKRKATFLRRPGLKKEPDDITYDKEPF